MPDPSDGTTLSDGSKVVVDREICMGSGICIVYAPESFAHDDETKAVVIDPPGDPLDKIRTAVDACPMGALSLIPTVRGG